MLLARCLLVVVTGVACDDVALGKDGLSSQVGILRGTAFIVNYPRLGQTPAEQFAPRSAD
jgi:hypothetical protein